MTGSQKNVLVRGAEFGPSGFKNVLVGDESSLLQSVLTSAAFNKPKTMARNEKTILQ